MRRALYLMSAVLSIAACQKKELSHSGYVESSDLYTSMEAVDATKTAMDLFNNVLWSDGDQVIAFRRSTLGQRYQIKEQYVGSTTGSFSKIAEQSISDDLETGQELDHNVVLYPYSELVWCMKNDDITPTESYKLNIHLPEVQTYAENSFSNGSFPMIAVSAGNQLTFKNICGGLKLQFKGSDRIKSIKLEGMENEPISGQASVVGYADGSDPVTTMSTAASTSLTLDCGDGVQLNTDSPVTFIIAVPPTEFKSGMKITVTDTDGLSKTLTNTSANTIKRSSLLTFPVITYTQNGIFEFAEGAETAYEFPAEGGTIEIPVVTNIDFDVVCSTSWLSLAETKALRNESIRLVAKECPGKKRSTSISIVDASSREKLASVKISQKGGVEFNENHCIYYKENESGGQDGEDYCLNRSYIECNAKGTKVEMKFRMKSSSSIYLAAGSNVMKDCDKFMITESYLYLYDYINKNEEESYIWYWSDIGVSPTDLITLTFSGKDETITVNGKVLDCPGMSSMSWNYLFSAFGRERDEGEWKSYYGVPDGSELYYVKMYSAQGSMTYEGFAAKAVNPATSKYEYCWYSKSGSTETFQFANDAHDKGGYGGNF